MKIITTQNDDIRSKDISFSVDGITKEIDTFMISFFKDIVLPTEQGLEFIQKNKLTKPKENYLTIIGFLKKTINYFEHLDCNFSKSASKKISVDIDILYKLYNYETNKHYDINIAFNNNFLRSSKIIAVIWDEIIKLEFKINLSPQGKERLSQLSKEYNELKEIYLKYFNDIFEKNKNTFLKSLLEVINSKLYYLDRMLWLEAPRYTVISRFLIPLKLTKSLNSEKYLQYKLTIEPYSQNYKYLQKCLRIYK